MSYNKKNNLKSHLDFLNKFLPLYGIHGVCDVDTEIRSTDLTKFDKMTDMVEEIQQLFKTSIMNLSRNNYKITQTNAIPILKHLCIQAHIPFDITKYPKYYTFSLAPTNVLLEEYRRNRPSTNTIKIFNENNPKTEFDSLKPLKPLKPLSYFDKLSCRTVPGIYNYAINDKHECIKIGGDIKNDILPLLDIEYSVSMEGIKSLLVFNTYQSALVTGVLSGKIKSWFTTDNKKCISIPLPRGPDILRKIIDVKLYDENGNCFYTGNKADFNLGIIYPVMKDITNLDYPIWNQPYHDIYLHIPYTNIQPCFYKIELECQYIQQKYRKMSYEDWFETHPIESHKGIW